MSNLRAGLSFARRHARDAGWTGTDQVLSSISNVIVPLAVARAGGAEALGEYAVAFSIYLIFLGFQRQLVSEPFLSQSPGKSDPPSDERSSATMVLIGLLPVAAFTVVVGWAIRLDHVVALGLVAVPLGLHDQLRYAAFRRKTPWLAALIDAVWVGVLLPLWPLLTRTDTATAVLAWGGAAGIAVLPALVILRMTPDRLGRALAWWRDHAQKLGGYFAIAAIAHMAGTHLTMVGLAGIIGVAPIGELRAAQILMAPATLLETAAGFVLIPRLAARRERLTNRNAHRVAAGAGFLVFGMVIIVLILRVPLATLLFGLDVIPEHSTVIFWGVVTTLLAVAWAYAVMLRADRQGRAIASTYVVAYSLGTVAVLLLGAIGDLPGALVGYVLQAAVLAVSLLRGWAGTRDESNSRSEASHGGSAVGWGEQTER